MPKPKPLPPVELLRENLHYDPDTGEFTWLKAVNSRSKPGSRAGKTNQNGYRIVTLHRGSFRAHRLAWLMQHGADPGERQIDHRDGDRLNNRIDNLRLATHGQNQHNVKLLSSNTSGVKGVSWSKARKKWQAHIQASGKGRYLGRFATIEEAEAAVRAAREERHRKFTHHG